MDDSCFLMISRDAQHSLVAASDHLDLTGGKSTRQLSPTTTRRSVDHRSLTVSDLIRNYTEFLSCNLYCHIIKYIVVA